MDCALYEQEADEVCLRGPFTNNLDDFSRRPTHFQLGFTNQADNAIFSEFESSSLVHAATDLKAGQLPTDSAKLQFSIPYIGCARSLMIFSNTP